MSSKINKQFKTDIILNPELESFLINYQKSKNNSNIYHLQKTTDNKIDLSLFTEYLTDIGLIEFPNNYFYYKTSN
jgi:hypothetical protein